MTALLFPSIENRDVCFKEDPSLAVEFTKALMDLLLSGEKNLCAAEVVRSMSVDFEVDEHIQTSVQGPCP